MVIIRNSIWKNLLKSIVAAIFVGIFILLMQEMHGVKVFTSGLGAILFAYFGLQAIYNLFDRREKIVIEKNGLQFPGKDQDIEWQAIKSIDIKTKSGNYEIFVEKKGREDVFICFSPLDMDVKKIARLFEVGLKAQSEDEFAKETGIILLNDLPEIDEEFASESENQEMGDFPIALISDPYWNDLLCVGLLIGIPAAFIFFAPVLEPPPKLDFWGKLFSVIGLSIFAMVMTAMNKFKRSFDKKWKGDVNLTVKPKGGKKQKKPRKTN